MLERQMRDLAGFFADSDSINPDDWHIAFQNHLKLCADSYFNAYGNVFDMGYERMAFILALFHEFEVRWLAQSSYMDAIDHPNADEVFAFELYDSIRKGALRRMFGADVNPDCWNFFTDGEVDG